MITTDDMSLVAKTFEGLGITGVVFVGGATIGLFLTDTGAPEPRETIDVDVIAPVPTRLAYNALEERLRSTGYRQPTGQGNPVCRWIIEGVTVDLMPPDETILGFSNRWYQGLIEHAEEKELTDGTIIRVASAPTSSPPNSKPFTAGARATTA